jgi:hypothetical protein
VQAEEQQAPARRSLRSIVDELLTLIDDVEGEVNDEIEQLQLSVEQKVEAYAVVIKQWAAEGQAFEDLAKRYKENAARRDEQIARLKARLAAQLERLGVDRLKTKTVTAFFKESESVDLDDEAAFCVLHRQTVFVRTKLSPDKPAIKEALDRGLSYEGASIKTTRSLQLR